MLHSGHIWLKFQIPKAHIDQVLMKMDRFHSPLLFFFFFSHNSCFFLFSFLVFFSAFDRQLALITQQQGFDLFPPSMIRAWNRKQRGFSSLNNDNWNWCVSGFLPHFTPGPLCCLTFTFHTFLRRRYFSPEGQNTNVTGGVKNRTELLRYCICISDANFTFTTLIGHSGNTEMMKPSSVTSCLCNMWTLLLHVEESWLYCNIYSILSAVYL